MPTNFALKRVPYGIDSFSDVRNGNYAYIDKTQYIEVLERYGSDKPFIVRPRRFGKTLFTSTLSTYYDRNQTNNFDKLFAGTYIADHKTSLANQFCILRLEFAGLSSSSDIELRFKNCVLDKLNIFFNTYPHPQQNSVLNGQFQDAAELIARFFAVLGSEYKKKLYVIVDEYDQFANNILSDDLDKFRSITSTHGFLKDFYTQLKEAAGEGGPIAKIFITGVTTISLDSMTSGFSVAKNLSFKPQTASLFGFTEAELRELIPQVLDFDRYGHTLDEVVSRMKELYNGYRFSPYTEETVFNASMCLYYLDNLCDCGEEPDPLLDTSVSNDLSKIHGILKLGTPQDVADIMLAALARKSIPFGGTPEVMNLQEAPQLSRDGLLSALFYFGYLTYAPGNSRSLIVPNRAMALQFFETYFKYLRKLPDWKSRPFDYDAAFKPLAEGNPRPLVESVTSALRRACGNHKSLHLRESDFQTALLIAASYAPGYEYAAELEVRGEDHGYVDLLLKSSTGGPSYLFELKYLTKAKGSPTTVAQKLKEAQAQAIAYAHGDNLKNIPQLKRVAAVFVGLELQAFDVTP